jgi:putative flippase GtrA
MLIKVGSFIEYSLSSKFIRFLFVGGLNAAFGYSVYAILIYLHVHYSLAVLMATFLGVLFNFKTTGRLVFKSKNNWLIFKFIGVYVIIYAVNTAALKIFNFFKVDLYLAGAVMLLPMAVVAFILNKNIVFKG